MTVELTPGTTWRATITAPAAGDARTAASVQVMGQDLADSIGYLNALTGTSGVVKVRSVTTTGALKALTGMAEGDIALLYNFGTTPYAAGLYVFDLGSASPQEEPWVYTANDATGVWRHSLHGITQNDNVAQSVTYDLIPSIDRTGGKLAYPNIVPYRTVTVERVTLDGPDPIIAHFHSISGDTNYHTLTDGGGTTFETGSIVVLNGDIIKVDAHAGANLAGATGGQLRANVRFDAADHEVGGSRVIVAAGTTVVVDYSMSGVYVMGANKTITVRLEGAALNAVNALQVWAGASLVVTVIRP